MIEWVKKQYVSIILVALLGVFGLTRLKTLHQEKGQNGNQQIKASSEQAAGEGVTLSQHLSDDKKEPCVGPSCGSPTPVNEQPTPTSTPTKTDVANTPVMDSPIVAKEKACDEKFNEACIELAELKESQGDKASALKFYQKACRPPDVDIEACGDVGKLMNSNDADQARRECESGQLHKCVSLSGYYYENNDKSQAKQWNVYGCKNGLTEACISVGYLLTDEEIKASKGKCKQGSAQDCLYVAGQGSFQEKYAQQSEYLLKACDLGDQTSCLRIGEEVSDDKVEALNKSCLSEGKVTACLLSIGKNSTDSHEGKNPELQKKLIIKACELGNKTACTSLEK